MGLPLRQYWELLVEYLRPQALRVGILAGLLLGTIGLQLLGPQIVRSFIDTAIAGGSLEVLTNAAVLYLGVAMTQQILSVGATYVGETVGWTATNAIRVRLALHCLRHDLSFHKRHAPGELIERIDGDVTALANFFSQFIIRVVGNVLLLLGVLLVLAWEDWRLGVAFTVFAAVALGVMFRIRGVAVPHWVRVRQASAEMIAFIEERLAGTEDIRANGMVGYVMRRFFQLARDRIRLERRGAFFGSIFGSSMTALFAVGLIGSFVLGASLLAAGAITLGTVFLIFVYIEMLQRPVSQITQQIEDLQKASAGITRVQELLRMEPRVQDGPGVALPPGHLEVELDGVTFAYEEEAVLRDVTVHLQAGRVLGLLGRTGSGKTTITRLLLRQYDAQAGAIRLGGVEVRQLRLSELRERVGMVTQDVQLFHASVRDNLTFFDPAVADDRILGVLRELGLWSWYESLPAGLDTELASDGSGLSAGEAQLLAFARVFLKDPGLVILDEASSRLDPATEQRLELAVDKLLRDRTAIVIAHRLRTVGRADDILILEDGQVREHGERERLLRDPGSRFNELLRTGLEAVLA